MKITVLVDNNTFIDQYLVGEPAVSYYIETGGKKILFDVGYSDVFLNNALKLGIKLTEIDIVVLSHGHQDHTWGLVHLIRYFTEVKNFGKNVKKPVLIAHPMAFSNRSYESDPEIGSLLKPESLDKFFNIELTTTPKHLTDKLIFLGEIERLNDFEAQTNLGTVFWNNYQQPDMVMDDSALVYQSEEGLMIITGCSHSGICNIVEYAKKLTGTKQVLDILGGFHLLNPPLEQMERTVSYFRDLKPKQLHACHCTDLQSKMKLAETSDLKEVGSGLILEY